MNEMNAVINPELIGKNRATLDALKAGKFTDEITDVIEAAAKEISAKYN